MTISDSNNKNFQTNNNGKYFQGIFNKNIQFLSPQKLKETSKISFNNHI